jgi:hypothetical protein
MLGKIAVMILQDLPNFWYILYVIKALVCLNSVK